jgi:hypothetical protein
MIAADKLAAVGEAARASADIAALRGQFPELHFTVCSDDDVSPNYRPALELGEWNLYYIAGADGHCLSMTNDPEMATGILLAEKVADEDD